MRHLFKLLLVASLALNIVLFATKPRSAAPEAAALSGSPGDSAPAPTPPAPPPAPTPSAPALPKAPAAPAVGGDPANALLPKATLISIRDYLLAVGAPVEAIRNIMQMLVWTNYEKEFKATRPYLNRSEAEKSWWKDNQPDAEKLNARLTEQQQAEFLDTIKQATAEIENLLVVDDKKDLNPPNRFSYLPSEKAKALKKIEQDYEQLIMALGNNSSGDESGASAPGDDPLGEGLRLLDKEKKRDIAALLNPAEREAYDLRESDTAKNLRPLITALDATEAEYRSIFRLQQAFDDKYGVMNNPAADPDLARNEAALKNRAAAEAALEAQIKALVGDERYKTAMERKIKLDMPFR